MEPYGVVVTALWAMLPAYIPNNAAVLAGGGRPIDGGRTLGGSRMLGDGKTWRGTTVGWAAGAALALALNAIHLDAGDVLGVSLPEFPLVIVIALPLGAMLGDIGASFLKRRTGRERGAPFPGVDQLDFVVGALLVAGVADLLFVSPSWFDETFTVPVLVVVVVVTPLLHVLTNGLAYALGLKDEPW
jgi:CDP-2,3-bis-(O-geranylgeranyl)-sn-glycerol synthase